jgi:hypothetical protein
MNKLFNDEPDAIDELVARSKDHKKLRAFHRFHREHPEVLDALVTEIDLLIDNGHTAFSFASLWHYFRWKLLMKAAPPTQGPTGRTFIMNDHATPFYSRAIIVIHPRFNGLAEFRKSVADEVFGTRIEPLPERPSSRYSRRLVWADGTPIERGWRPTIFHVAKLPANRRPDIH